MPQFPHLQGVADRAQTPPAGILLQYHSSGISGGTSAEQGKKKC